MINSAHLGNGLVVWDNSRIDPETNDYFKIALIDVFRMVYFYTKPTNEEKKIVIDLAFNDDREVSITQDQKVFERRPSEVDKILIINKWVSKTNPKRTEYVTRNS